MNFFNIFGQKEKGTDFIGKFECTAQKLPDIFVRLMDTMGMSNPSGYVQNASKAITIKKNGDKYTIFINTYNPPLAIQWTEPFVSDDLVKVINRLVAGKNKRIGYLNVTGLNNGYEAGEFYQLALA